MTGPALAFVAAVAVSAVVPSARARPPATLRAQAPEAQIALTPAPRAVCRTPAVRGDNRVDPRFVAAPKPEVRFSIRRLMGEKLDCPDPVHPKR
jgi:hypothetical protein